MRKQASSIPRRLNYSRISIIAIVAAVMSIILYCNFNSLLAEDDFFYSFSWLDGARITKASQILPSMIAHRSIQNGRIHAHFLVQLFLMLPLWIFDVVNSTMFAAMIVLIYTIARNGRRHNALILLSIFGAIWILQPNISEVLFWLDGSINYLWGAVFSLLWLLPFINEFLGNNKEMTALQKILFFLFSYFVGGYNENTTAALLLMALLFTVSQKENGRSWKIHSILFMLLGFAEMISAPAEISNKAAGFSVNTVVSNFLTVSKILIEYYWAILLIFLILYILDINSGEDKKTRLLALIIFAGAMTAQYILIFASYCPGRSMLIVLVFMLLSCALLSFDLADAGKTALICVISAACFLLTAYYLYVGISDIRLTHYKMEYNIQLIQEAKSNGENEVRLPIVHPATRYSVGYGWPYLSELFPQYFTNRMMAKYFEIGTIYGYELYTDGT